MHTQIINTSLHADNVNNTWLFLAHGRDGSIYMYNTFSSIFSTSEGDMFSQLKGLVKDGLINTDYWRLV